jgi:hypothetical protein
MVTPMIFPDSEERRLLTSLRQSESQLMGSGKAAGPPPPVNGDAQAQAVRAFAPGERHRARRFAISTSLRFRLVGDGEWRQGTLVNISESGMLFLSQQAAQPNATVEIRFGLSTGKAGESPVQVACRGMIVRSVADAGRTAETGLAAKIIKFHFLRPRQGPPV